MKSPVLLLSRSLDPGGSERQLAETAIGLDRERWEPHVGCFHGQGPRGDDLRRAGVPVVEFPVRSFANPSLITGARLMGRYLREHRIELVHSFDVPMNIFGALTARFYRCPNILTSQRAFRELVKPREHKLLRLTDRITKGIVVNCEALRHHLAHDEGVPPERVHLCYNGLDLARFSPEPRQRQPALATADLVIGCACVLRPEKDLPTLVSGFARMRRTPGTKLVLVGSGPMREPLGRQVSELGIADQVHFEPSTAEVTPWLRSIDIFVLPSRSEALSNSLMEAQACGCAAVASRVGGNPELALEGETGFTFPVSDPDALARILENLGDHPELRQQIALAGRRRMESDFSRATAVRRMGEIYEQVMRA